MVMPNIPSKFFTAFNEVTYYDKPHKYYLGNKELISVTTLIHKYVEEFDEEYWGEIKAREYDVNKQTLIDGWRFVNLYGTTKGSVIHDYAENLLNNKIFPYPKAEIINTIGYDPIYPSYLKQKKIVDTFHRLSKKKLIPVRTEFIVYDKEFMVGGMVDVLFYNIKTKKFELYDWKTNKKYLFKSEPRGQKETTFLEGVLSELEDCEHTIYSLQLSLYKHIIEKNTGIELGDSYLVWLSEKEGKFYTHKAEDYVDLVKKLLVSSRFDLKFNI